MRKIRLFIRQLKTIGRMKEQKFNSEQDTFEFDVDPKDFVIVKRQLFGKTERDIEIERLEIPKEPFWLKMIVKLIRFYRIRVSDKLGNRCVFDPSCSHYAEMAYRKKGFLEGTKLTLKRLYRCRPENGGIDELE